MNESEFRAKHQAAADALFALECAISPDDLDPTRKSVYRLRVELGFIANKVLRELTDTACQTCDGTGFDGVDDYDFSKLRCADCRGIGRAIPGAT